MVVPSQIPNRKLVSEAWVGLIIPQNEVGITCTGDVGHASTEDNLDEGLDLGIVEVNELFGHFSDITEDVGQPASNADFGLVVEVEGGDHLLAIFDAAVAAGEETGVVDAEGDDDGVVGVDNEVVAGEGFVVVDVGAGDVDGLAVAGDVAGGVFFDAVEDEGVGALGGDEVMVAADGGNGEDEFLILPVLDEGGVGDLTVLVAGGEAVVFVEGEFVIGASEDVEF